MKILVVGDFHGKFPGKLKRLAKEVDLVVSLGDYPMWSLKKLFFEHCYKTEKNLWDVMGKRKYKRAFLKDWKTAESVMRKLNSFDVPVFSIVGNYDNHVVNDSCDMKRVGWKWAAQDFFGKTIVKYSHIKRFDYKAVKIGGLF